MYFFYAVAETLLWFYVNLACSTGSRRATFILKVRSIDLPTNVIHNKRIECSTLVVINLMLGTRFLRFLACFGASSPSRQTEWKPIVRLHTAAYWPSVAVPFTIVSWSIVWYSTCQRTTKASSGRLRKRPTISANVYAQRRQIGHQPKLYTNIWKTGLDTKIDLSTIAVTKLVLFHWVRLFWAGYLMAVARPVILSNVMHAHEYFICENVESCLTTWPLHFYETVFLSLETIVNDLVFFFQFNTSELFFFIHSGPLL